MTLTQLKYFIAVVEELSFGKAAQRVHVSQPSLSVQVQNLEDELGAPLIDRSTHPVRVTTLGRQVFVQAKQILESVEALASLASKETGEIEGELRLGIIPTLAPYLLPLFLHDFASHYPRLELIIEEMQTAHMIEALRDGRLDLGLLVTPLGVPQIKEHPLFEEPFCVYVSPEHPLAARQQIKESDLRAEELWLLSEGHCFRDQVLKICGGNRKKTQGLSTIQFASGNLETLRSLVDQGSGYTLLPYLATLSLRGAHKDQVKNFSQPIPTREVSLVHNHVFAKQKALEAMLAVIREKLPKELQQIQRRKWQRVPMS